MNRFIQSRFNRSRPSIDTDGECGPPRAPAPAPAPSSLWAGRGLMKRALGPSKGSAGSKRPAHRRGPGAGRWNERHARTRARTHTRTHARTHKHTTHRCGPLARARPSARCCSASGDPGGDSDSDSDSDSESSSDIGSDSDSDSNSDDDSDGDSDSGSDCDYPGCGPEIRAARRAGAPIIAGRSGPRQRMEISRAPRRRRHSPRAHTRTHARTHTNTPPWQLSHPGSQAPG